MTFDQLVEEVLQEDYLEEVNWKGALAAGAMLPSLIGGGLAAKNAYSNSNQPERLPSIEDLTGEKQPIVQTKAMPVFNTINDLYQAVMTGSEPVKIKRGDVVKLLYGDNANTYIQSMPVAERDYISKVYGPKSSEIKDEVLNYTLAKFNGTGGVAGEEKSGNIFIYNSSMSLDGFKELLTHEGGHVGQYARKELGDNLDTSLIANLANPIQINSIKKGPDFAYYNTLYKHREFTFTWYEIQARVSGSRDKLGPAENWTGNKFDQYWQRYTNKPLSYLVQNKVPENMIQLIAGYNLLTNAKEKQKYFNFIKGNVLNNGIVTNTQPTNTKVS